MVGKAATSSDVYTWFREALRKVTRQLVVKCHRWLLEPAPLWEQNTASLLERFASRDNFDYAGKALSAMRMQFGGHHEKES